MLFWLEQETFILTTRYRITFSVQRGRQALRSQVPKQDGQWPAQTTFLPSASQLVADGNVRAARCRALAPRGPYLVLSASLAIGASRAFEVMPVFSRSEGSGALSPPAFWLDDFGAVLSLPVEISDVLERDWDAVAVLSFRSAMVDVAEYKSAC